MAISGRKLLLLGGSTLAFAIGYGIANRFQLTHGVLYRLAANDLQAAAINLLSLFVQAIALLAAINLLSRRTFIVTMLLAFVSIAVNLGYGQTLGDTIDTAKLGWLVSEARLATSAAGEFAWPLTMAITQAVIATLLFATSRALAYSIHDPENKAASWLGVGLLIGPSLVASLLPAQAAERNLYAGAFNLALAALPPERRSVTMEPDIIGSPRHIVWLIDESVAYQQFSQLIAPRLANTEHIDFGRAVSMASCSAPSNLALRSGVEVRKAGRDTDLKTTPSIWAYAMKAGYQTVLIDGQTNGAPQNMLFAPERKLINELRPAAGGLDTDLRIAESLNRQFRSKQKTFTYVVLRGVHFQYRDHYPAGAIPADSSTIRQYETALFYSKGRFFDRLLKRVDRNEVAVIYTSDHGQNLEDGVLPHCSRSPAAVEYYIPIVAFLPKKLADHYASRPPMTAAASQIFPTTLVWMGYRSEEVQAQYDNELNKPPAGYVRFGRDLTVLKDAA